MQVFDKFMLKVKYIFLEDCFEKKENFFDYVNVFSNNYFVMELE